MMDTTKYADTAGLIGIIVDKAKNEQFGYQVGQYKKRALPPAFMYRLRDQHTREKLPV